MPLPDKTAKELGFKEGDQFRVVSEKCWFKVGTLVTLTDDDNTNLPYFTDDAGDTQICYFSELETLEVQAKETSFKVGDRVRVSQGPSSFQGKTGIVVDITSDPWHPKVRFKDQTVYVSPGLLTKIEDDAHSSDQEKLATGGWITGVDWASNDVYRHSFTLNHVSTSPMANNITTTTERKPLMKRLSIMARKALDKDTKTLIKAGVLNDTLQVIDQQFVLDFVAAKYKSELAADAQERLDEEQDK